MFFALWPETVLRAGLERTAQRITLRRPARRVPAYNLHLTLHFIGNIFRHQLDCLQRQARQVEARAFDLEIDSIGHFVKPRVAWLGCSRVPAELARLYELLGRRLRSCDYQPEPRAYHPHVTVARKLARAPASFGFDPLTWRVKDFALIESRSMDKGVQYEVVETYPLT